MSLCQPGKGRFKCGAILLACFIIDLGFSVEPPSWSKRIMTVAANASIVRKREGCDIRSMLSKARRNQASLKFTSLNDDAMATIAMQLDIKDRLSFLSCCRSAKEFQRRSSHCLWPRLAFSLAEPPGLIENFALWVGTAQRQLDSLCLSETPSAAATADTKADGGEASQALAGERSSMRWLLLGALSGSTLRTLQLNLQEAPIGPWVGLLPQLESLQVTAANVTLQHWGLLGAASLTRLVLDCEQLFPEPCYIKWPPGGLSPSLRELEVRGFAAASFAEHALLPGALPHLNSLTLDRPDQRWQHKAQWEALASLHQSLTCLCLTGWDMPEVRPQLAALTGLQELSLEGQDFEGAAAAVLPLGVLSQLSKLSLADTCLRGVPPCVLQLPKLKELDLSCNIIEAPLALESSTLTHLTLDEDTAGLSAGELSGLSALHTLRLKGTDWSDGIDSTGTGRVIQSLMKIPGFAVLDAGEVFGEPSTFYVAKEVLNVLGVISFEIISDCA